ncbi:hypothetical protein RDV78_06480 [Bacillota bacterium LX-D]|nr:hypothetical protein [Bacillota bacterium LX-D]
MPNINKNDLGQRIIKLTDMLIEQVNIICELSEGNISMEYKRGLAIVRYLIFCVYSYLESDDKHVEEMLNQIVNQKLSKCNDFNNSTLFNKKLNELISKSVEFYRSNTNAYFSSIVNNKNIDTDNIMEEEIKTNLTDKIITDVNIINEDDKLIKCINNDKGGNNSLLDKFIKIKFSNCKLYTNYRLLGIKLDYYIPDLHLAICCSDNLTKGSIWEDYYCSNANIKFVSVTSDDLLSYNKLNRKFKRFA